MDTDLIKNKFERIGARVRVVPLVPRIRSIPLPVSIDIRSDRRGEYFDVVIDPRQVTEVDAIDVQPDRRHLLLMVRTEAFDREAPAGPSWLPRRIRRTMWRLPPKEPEAKSKFLCGHDERHWFVAAVPEAAHASNVRTAMEALKPELAMASQERAGVRYAERMARKNRGFVRQGEWFFVPRPEKRIDERLVLRNEALSRGRGKAHWAEFAYREGGQTVYVSRSFPLGLSKEEFGKYVQAHPSERGLFRVMMRDAGVFVRGRISHPDHATVVLREWHEVAMNTENRARAMRHVAFLD